MALGLTPLAHAKRLRGLIRHARGNAFLATRDAEQGRCVSALSNLNLATFQHGLLQAHQESIGKSRAEQAAPYYRRIVGRIPTNQAEYKAAVAAVEKLCLRRQKRR
jgi:hypothetical protein